jgi:hypothetical protein
LEEAIYLVRPLAVDRSVKSSLGRVLNKIIEDCLEIALKFTAFCIIEAPIAKSLRAANLSMESSDEGWNNNNYVE